MEIDIGQGKTGRRSYSFDEITIVPSRRTRDPEDIDISVMIDKFKLELPVLASAMDGVVDVAMAAEMSKLGGLAVLNLEGIQTRYENPGEVLRRIARSTPQKATELVQSIYLKPIKEKLISKRIRQIKKIGVPCAVSAIPQRAERFGRIAQEAGCDIFVSLHLNDFEDDNAEGLEVLYKGDDDIPIAQALQNALLRVTGFRDREIKKRDNLAVLKFAGIAVLIELGFIANDGDRNALLNPQKRFAICEAIADVIGQNMRQKV